MGKRTQVKVLKWRERGAPRSLIISVETPLDSVVKDMGLALAMVLVFVLMGDTGFGVGVLATLGVIAVFAFNYKRGPGYVKAEPAEVGSVIDEWLQQLGDDDEQGQERT